MLLCVSFRNITLLWNVLYRLKLLLFQKKVLVTPTAVQGLFACHRDKEGLMFFALFTFPPSRKELKLRMQRRQISWRTNFAAFWENLNPKNQRRQGYVSLCTGPVLLMNKYFKTVEMMERIMCFCCCSTTAKAEQSTRTNTTAWTRTCSFLHDTSMRETSREDSDHRPSQDTSFQDGSRGRGWQQHEYMPVERHQEHHHSERKEPGTSNRIRYEGNCIIYKIITSDSV